VILPDATIALDYMQHQATRVVTGMTVHAGRMRENLELTWGAIYSQRALTALVDAGLDRDDAYRIVQENAQRAWDEQTPFRDLLATALAGSDHEVDLDAIFDPTAYLTHAGEVFERLEALRQQGPKRRAAGLTPVR
jgi:adenylosuccinate lyase